MEARRKNTAKDRTYTFLILLCLYLFFVSFPYKNFVSGFHGELLQSAGRLIFIVFAFLSFSRYGFPEENFFAKDKPIAFLFLPLFLLCFTNLLYLAIDNGNIAANPNYLYLFHYFGYYLLVAFAEELLFRYALIAVLPKTWRKEWRLLLSALIFALLHLANLFAGSNVLSTLAQVGYTFVLGLFLGFIYLYGGGFLLAFLLHFLFDFFNAGLYSLLNDKEESSVFYVVNIAIGAALIIYSLLIYRKRRN